jgi:translation initiation factor 4E
MAEQVDLSTIPVSPEGGNDASTSTDAAAAASSSKPVTVFDDKDNFNVKHPLAHDWTLWFTKPPSGKVRRKLCPAISLAVR